MRSHESSTIAHQRFSYFSSRAHHRRAATARARVKHRRAITLRGQRSRRRGQQLVEPHIIAWILHELSKTRRATLPECATNTLGRFHHLFWCHEHQTEWPSTLFKTTARLLVCGTKAATSTRTRGCSTKGAGMKGCFKSQKEKQDWKARVVRKCYSLDEMRGIDYP